MKKYWMLGILAIVASLMAVVVGFGIAGASSHGNMGAMVGEGFLCGLGGGVDRDGHGLPSLLTTDSHEVKNSGGHQELTCQGTYGEADGHLPEQGVMQVGPGSVHASKIGKGNKVEGIVLCGLLFGGLTTNNTQTFDTEGNVTLKCVAEASGG